MLKLVIKKWLLLFLLAVSVFFIAGKTSMPLFQIFFWLLVSFIALNAASVLLGYYGNKLYFQRQGINRVVEGDILNLGILVKNDGFLPGINIALEDNLPCAPATESKKRILIGYLGPGVSMKLKYSCLCYLRGKYSLGPVAVYFFDPFGLFFMKKTYYDYCELYVYPKTFRIKRFPNLTRGILPWFGIESTRVSGDDDEFFGVREYLPGDPISRVHWLSSARKNQLIIKQFQRQSYFRATIMFNLEKDKNFGEGKESVSEYIIKIAASVVEYLTNKGIDISVQVIVEAGHIFHIPFNRGYDHLEEIMKFLTVAKPESEVTIAQIFEEFNRYIPDDSTLIVVMTDTDWDFFPSLLALEKRNISVIPLIIMSSTFLYSFDRQLVEKEIAIKMASIVNIKPLCFSKGENLEEAFLK